MVQRGSFAGYPAAMFFSAFIVLAIAASPGVDLSTSDVKALHERMLVLDTHLDTPIHFARAGWDVTKRHTVVDDLSQVDLPRMIEGGLDGGFFVVFTPQGPLTKDGYAAARDHALVRLAAIRETVAAHADRMELALTADDARRIAKSGKRVVFQSMENSYPVGEDLSLVWTLKRLGVRMAGPVHSRNNQLADSSTDKPRWRGLSPLGKRWVVEMNRAGLLIDGSHASDAALEQLIALSKTPVVLSHTGTRHVFDHARNVDDARLQKLAASGGVIQMNSLFLTALNESPKLEAVLVKLDVVETLSPAEQQLMIAAYRALDAKDRVTSPGATFETFMTGLLHVIAVAGVEHVGIGCDWDGGGGVEGLDDVTALPKITARLRAAGYSETDIEKIWSGNVLRVLDAAAKGSATQ